MSATLATAPESGSSAGSDFRFGPSARLPMLRNDLKITEAPLRGRGNYVVKDPVSLKYYRWGEKERRLASFLDGQRSSAEVLHGMRKEFPHDEITEEDIQTRMNQFLGAGLLITDGTIAQRIHHNQKQAIKQAHLKKLWLTVPSKLISFKFTLFDPDLLLLRMNRKLGFLWTWKAVAVLAVMLLVSAWLLTIDTGSLAMRMPDILGLQNIIILWIVLILVKVVHEFGHGLACKHFGGEVHEMGALFILLSPFLFCNASDSWVLREKWKRMVVNLSGMYVELFLAAVAAALWVLTQPGIFNQICFNIMFVCSVATVFFNANPLMKFDGYYALSDAMEVPNLKERGDRALITRLAGLFTGGAGVIRDPIVESMKWQILFYAVASYLWMFFMAYNILSAMGYMLQPYGLDRLVQAAAGMVLLVGMLTPLILVGVQITKVVRSDEDGFVTRRVVISFGIALAAVALLSLVPIPITVKSALVVDSVNRVRVTASTPGFVRAVEVRDGQAVAAGEPLAVLENRELEKSFANMKNQAEVAKLKESAVISGQFDQFLPAVRALTAQYESAIAKYSADIDALTLKAPEAGTVVGLSLELKKGNFLRKGDLFCELIPEGALQAVIALSENETSLVEPGQKVSFRLRSVAGGTFHGRVVSVAPSPVQEFPHESLGQHAGGTVPSVMTASSQPGGQPVAIPSSQIYKAQVAIDNPDGLLRPGMSGRIRISCGTKALGPAIVHYLRNMVRTDFQL